ncbi:MAG: ExbD/TolR family protein [Phycisphaeraceae bacterium]
MSHVTRRGPVKPTLNITPLIDVVFLLIVFFMIVNNIVTDEVPELQLPDLIEPQTFQAEGKNRVIINLIPKQEFTEGGKKVGPDQPEGQVLARGGEARAVAIGGNEWDITKADQIKAFQEFAAKTIAARMKSNDGEPPMILLRADAALYYNAVLPMMTTLQQAMVEALGDKAGQTPIHLVAYLEE